MTDGDSRFLVAPDAGEHVGLYGLEVVYKVAGEATRGGLSIVEHVINPGILVKPHVHHREDEISIVLAGAIAAKIGDEVVRATAGSYLVKPRDIPHALWNDGTEPSRVAEIVTPAGFEAYFRELAPVLTPNAGVPVYRALAEEYGIEVLDDWTDELKAKYGVTL